MIKPLLCISAGASLGAVLRWLLGLWLNAALPLLPMGTLAANLLGGYCIGIALSAFSVLPGIGPEWRLLIITGFLGGLTTFSTFSGEVCSLLQQQRLLPAFALVGLHVGGSLIMTFLGVGTFALVRHTIQ